MALISQVLRPCRNFLIRNNQVLSSTPPTNYSRSETKSYPPHTSTNCSPPSETTTKSPPSPTVVSPKRTIHPPPSAPSSTSTPTPPSYKTSYKSQEIEKSKILLIGDSISSNIDIDVLENATKRKFVTAKAYSAVHDIVSM